VFSRISSPCFAPLRILGLSLISNSLHRISALMDFVFPSTASGSCLFGGGCCKDLQSGFELLEAIDRASNYLF
jgi:hypothetical protein